MLVITVVASLVGGLWWVGSKVESPEQRAAEAAAPEPSLIGVPVEFRVLADTIVTRGDVAPVGAVDVEWTSAAALIGVVTSTPHAVGDPVSEGQPLIEVAGRPMFFISGSLPVYRDLVPGSSGDDVRQLQEVLTRLGFDPAEHDGVFGPGTKLAVTQWYEAAGYRPAATSGEATAQLAAALTAVDDAQDAVTAANVALMLAAQNATGSTLLEAQASVDAARRSLSDARVTQSAQTSEAQAELEVATAAYDRIIADPAALASDTDQARAAVVRAQTALTTAKSSTESATANAVDALAVAQARLAEASATPDTSEEQIAVDAAQKRLVAAQTAADTLDRATGVMVPASELVVIPTASATVAAINVAVGAKAEGVLLTLTTSGLVVETLLDVSNAQLLQPGAKATLDSELSGESRSATLQSIAAEPVTPTEQNKGQSGYRAVITTDEPLSPDWLGRNLRVTITNAASDVETLVVPEAALFAQADGTTNVTRLDRTTGAATVVPVTTGFAAGGFVAITPTAAKAIEPGDLVVVGTQPAEEAAAGGDSAS